MKKIALIPIVLMLNLTQISYATTSDSNTAVAQAASPILSQAPKANITPLQKLTETQVATQTESTTAAPLAAQSAASLNSHATTTVPTNLTQASTKPAQSEETQSEETKQLPSVDRSNPTTQPTTPTKIQPISIEQLADVDSSNPVPKLQSLDASHRLPEQATTVTSSQTTDPVQHSKFEPLKSPITHQLARTEENQVALTSQTPETTSTSLVAPPITSTATTKANTQTQFIHISPQAASQLSNRVLSIHEISQGADETQNSYVSCLTQTHAQMQISSSQFDADTLISQVAKDCAPTEDLFGIYNVILAASQANQLLSETQAARYLDRSYQNYGREYSNRETRVKIMKLLGFI